MIGPLKVKIWPSAHYFILLYILYLWHSPPFWWKVEKCQICHLYHFRCRHIKLILIGPINGPFTPRVSCSNWIHMFRWHQMSSTKKSFRLRTLVQLILYIDITEEASMNMSPEESMMTCTWFGCTRWWMNLWDDVSFCWS